MKRTMAIVAALGISTLMLSGQAATANSTHNRTTSITEGEQSTHFGGYWIGEFPPPAPFGWYWHFVGRDCLARAHWRLLPC